MKTIIIGLIAAGTICVGTFFINLHTSGFNGISISPLIIVIGAVITGVSIGMGSTIDWNIDNDKGVN